ncbi:MAG: DUF1643 domain-containing protein [Smithellaceae bacterium]|nr:DUF1643 domain-containing protein [Smithellaceae bacterium]
MTYRHIAGAVARAWFSREGGRRFRYRLEITCPAIGPPGKTACVIMQNPSYANDEIADRSVQFMEKAVFGGARPEFAGVGRLIVVNLFALVQTKDFQGKEEDVGLENDSAITKALKESEIVILAWGKAHRFPRREARVMEILAEMPDKLLFLTKAHPSRGTGTDFIQPLPVRTRAAAKVR